MFVDSKTTSFGREQVTLNEVESKLLNPTVSQDHDKCKIELELFVKNYFTTK